MKNLMRLIMMVLAIMAVGFLAHAGEAPPERAEALALMKNFVMNSWPALLGWAISEAMPFLPTKANGIVQLVKLWLSTKQTAGRSCIGFIMALLAVMAISLVLMTGCTTLNVSLNTTSGDNNKPAIKTDADAKQDISPTTTASIPLK